jgi:hypothetical protein
MVFCPLSLFSGLPIRRFGITREPKDFFQNSNPQLPENKVEFLSSVP